MHAKYTSERQSVGNNTRFRLLYNINSELNLEISPGPILRLISDSSEKVKLSWKRQNMDNAAVLGYVIQMFPPSKYGEPKYLSLHLKYERRNENYTFGNLAIVQKFVFRVCIRNTLCIFEQSCSKKVGLHPGTVTMHRSLIVKMIHIHKEYNTIIIK